MTSSQSQQTCRVWVRRRWLWWSAINPDETLATCDTHTTLRSRTRDGAIDKWRKRLAPSDNPWEEVALDGERPCDA